VLVIGIFVGLGAFALQDWFGAQRAKGAARSIADLMMLARTEAIRTREPHLVFINQDASGGSLANSEGQPVAALLVRDDDEDGAPDGDEYVASVPFDSTGSLSWGSAFALVSGSEVLPPNDNPSASYPLSSGFACCSFTQPGGAEARWVAFMPDGTPRGFSAGPLSVGTVGSGTGSVYVTNGSRDYAVVLTALGGVRVHAFNEGNNVWRR